MIITITAILTIFNTLFIIHKTGGIYKIFTCRNNTRHALDRIENQVQELSTNFYNLISQIVDVEVALNKLVKRKKNKSIK
jgi:hypothetical protein